MMISPFQTRLATYLTVSRRVVFSASLKAACSRVWTPVVVQELEKARLTSTSDQGILTKNLCSESIFFRLDFFHAWKLFLN